MKEVYPGIFMITEKLSLPAYRPPANIYVITGINGLVYDAGYGTKEAVNYFVAEYQKIIDHCGKNNIPCEISRILISHTHPDHFSGLQAIRKKLGLKIVLTDKMAHSIASRSLYRRINTYKSHFSYKQTGKSFFAMLINAIFRRLIKRMFGVHFVKNPDVIITDDCDIDINGEAWSIFPSPGHCEDHISLYNPKAGILFSGDNVLSHTTTWLGPPRSNLYEYSQSLEYLLRLPKLEIIFGAHEKIITNPKNRIRTILKWRQKRIHDVYRIIEKNYKRGVDPDYIVGKLYPRRGQLYRYVVIGWIELTLDYLLENHYIEMQKHDGAYLFFPKKKFELPPSK